MTLGLTLAPLVSHAALLAFEESFEDVGRLAGRGWAFDNRSGPPGPGSWRGGTAGDPGAQAGSGESYLQGDQTACGATGILRGTLSDWLFTPEIVLGGELSFWTRTKGATRQDHLLVRFSTAGASTSVGPFPSQYGDFEAVALEVNPNYLNPSLGGSYPQEWTRYTVTIPGSGTGRVAFHHYAIGGEEMGQNGNLLSLDTVSYRAAAVPEPMSLLVLALGAAPLIRRRRSNAA